jgi:nucleotide-binding universal stress UspA family protein
MTIHTITLPVRGDGKGNNVLAHAAVLAKRFNAHVTVLHCRPRPTDLMPYGVPIPGFMRDQIKASASQLADEEEKTLRKEFTDLIAAMGLVERAAGGGVPSAAWQEAPGRQIDVLKHYGRLADLIMVSKPDRDRNLGANTLRSALFASGRPVLMCPPRVGVPTTLGERIAIGWNGSIEASRAVGLSMGLIESASEVTILSAGEEVHGATCEDLVAMLALRGIVARIERFEIRGSIGDQLLDHAQKSGADMLIMGAYGDSHERETVLGGNTQAVVDRATMPVVLVH